MTCLSCVLTLFLPQRCRKKLLDEASGNMRLFSYRKAFIVKQHEQELNTTPETAEEEQDEQYILARHKVAVKARLVLVMSETRPR